VNVAAATGDMGILANHVPSIEALRPGMIEVIESGNASKKWFGVLKILILFYK
jgi:F-type H+-transporting ATPase subunit delta